MDDTVEVEPFIGGKAYRPVVRGLSSNDDPETWTDEMPDALFIAQHSPDFMLRLYEGLIAEVERHVEAYDENLPGIYCVRCGRVACWFVGPVSEWLGLDAASRPSGGAPSAHAEGEPRSAQCLTFAGFHKGFPCGCCLPAGHGGPHAMTPPAAAPEAPAPSGANEGNE